MILLFWCRSVIWCVVWLLFVDEDDDAREYTCMCSRVLRKLLLMLLLVAIVVVVVFVVFCCWCFVVGVLMVGV